MTKLKKFISMPKRFLSLWFRYLLTDWKAIRQPELKGKAFIFAEPDHGRLVVKAVTATARKYGINEGMTVADAKVITPDLHVFDHKKGREVKLLNGLAEWCLRYTPLISLDPPDGLLLDITGCAHLRGGEREYLKDMIGRLKHIGYDIRPGIADTIGCAWGVARCAKNGLIVPEGGHRNALMPLPPSALRLPTDLLLKLQNLGLDQISSFVHMPHSVLRRRFQKGLVLRLLQALGQEEEFLIPLKEPVPYTERLECLEPLQTREAIEIAASRLLDDLCKRLYGEGKGLRQAALLWFRIDGKKGQIAVGTSQGTNNAAHLFKLFSLKFDQVEPGMGIELFVIEASQTEPVNDKQSGLWAGKPGPDSEEIAELVDRIVGRIGNEGIRRYLPSEHYWPERVAEPGNHQADGKQAEWWSDRPRPIQLLDPPELIQAMALTPDYPPKLFKYKAERHLIVAADGPERIADEWWMEPGEHRDYYIVEDEEGGRFWLFRSGHYDSEQPQQWYLHGYFA
jgi:protein ImuB